MNDDRVADVYDGIHGSREQQVITRSRIHWMCANAAGERVLDLGCSQGIASILLAREGRRVEGVDREEAAIRTARERLDREELSVRERVRFRHAEAHELEDREPYDTVLLGEVLEHQVDPARLMTVAAGLTAVDGVLVLTTPYGVHAYSDHKEPLYLREVIATIPATVAIERLELVDRYLCIVLRRLLAPARALPGPPSNALAIAESRLAEVDIQLDRMRDRLEEAHRKNRQLREDAAERVSVADEHERLAVLQAELVESRLSTVREQSRAVALEQERDRLRDDVAALRERLEHLLTEHAPELAELRAERDELKASVDRLTAEASALAEQRHELERLTTAVHERKRREQRLRSELDAQADNAVRLQTDRDAIQALLETTDERLERAESRARGLAESLDRCEGRLASAGAEFDAE